MDPFSEDPDKACDLFFEKIAIEPGQVVAAYWPKGTEIDPTAILEKLIKDNIICVLPIVVKGNCKLKFARWDGQSSLEKGPFGVQQPVQDNNTEYLDPDIVVVPMLAFDRRGYRLGYGGGYYDATLASLREKKKIIAVGLAYAQQAVLFNLPVEDHDEKLDWIITPQAAHSY